MEKGRAANMAATENGNVQTLPDERLWLRHLLRQITSWIARRSQMPNVSITGAKPKTNWLI